MIKKYFALVAVCAAVFINSCTLKEWDDGTNPQGLCILPRTWHYCTYTLHSTCACGGDITGGSYVCAENDPTALRLLKTELDLVTKLLATEAINYQCENTNIIGNRPDRHPLTEGSGSDPLPDLISVPLEEPQYCDCQ